MGCLTKQKLSSIATLSILLPLTLLAGFRLTGLLHGPAPSPETIMVEPVRWNMTRPPGTLYYKIVEWIGNSYVGDGLSVSLSIYLTEYFENDPSFAGLDVVGLRVFVNVSFLDGFVESMIVNFTSLDKHAALDLDEARGSDGLWDHIDMVNLEVVQIDDWDRVFGKNAYIKAVSVNQPKDTYLQFRSWWLFRDPNNTNHKLTVTLETILNKGDARPKIQVPIQLEVLSK
jgi:hypothetical protein